MSIQELRPTGSEAADFTSTPAGSAAHVILARAYTVGTPDAQFIQRTGAKQTRSAVIAFGSATVAANQQVEWVKVKVRASTPKSGNLTFAAGFRGPGGVNQFGPALALQGQKSANVYEGPEVVTAPGGRGRAWTTADLAAPRVQITDAASKGNRRGRTSLMSLLVKVATQGTTSVSAPSGTVTATSRPTVSWTFTDPDGSRQGFYQVKVFTAGQTVQLGFSPDASPAVWDSGERASPASSVRLGVSLENGDFVVYVRAGRSVASNPFWSAWATSAFTQDVEQPPAPSLSGTYSLEFGRVTLAAGVDALGTAFSARTVEFQRLDGTVFTDIFETALGTAAGTAFYVDYFAPRGGTVTYRARQVGALGDELIASPFGTATVSVANDGSWWFKPVDSLGNSMKVKVSPGWNVELDEQSQVYQPVGRDRNVVITSGLNGRSGSFTVTTVGETEWGQLEDVLDDTSPVFVEPPVGDGWFVRFLSRQWSTSGLSSNAVRQVGVDWVEV